MIGNEPLNLDKKDFDIVVCSACMISGHLPNNCYDTFLSVLKTGGQMVFSIRDKYMNSETDSGMNYHGALEEREQKGLMKKVAHIKFTKYSGLDMGTGYMEEGANIMAYEKL